MKQVTVLGATGSIGDSTLDLVRTHKDKFSVYCLSAHQNVEKLIRLAIEFTPKRVVITDEAQYAALKTGLQGLAVEIAVGRDALCEVAAQPVDIVVAGIVGFAGVEAMVSAVQAGQTIALANKETLVAAGHIIMPLARQHQATILPIDSEHNAIFQCMAASHKAEIQSITLTASGGAFRDLSVSDLLHVTPQQALQHPNWDMGAKVTIDSATLMNKGLELIEAAWLFDLPKESIHAVIHPQSIIHGLVSYKDGSVLAQLGHADMRVPISYALTYPDRLDWTDKHLNFNEITQLDFTEIDHQKYPAFRLARDVIGANPEKAIALNAANEVAVDAFLTGKIPFVAIPKLVEMVLDCDLICADTSLDAVIALDSVARARADEFLTLQY